MPCAVFEAFDRGLFDRVDMAGELLVGEGRGVAGGYECG